LSWCNVRDILANKKPRTGSGRVVVFLLWHALPFIVNKKPWFQPGLDGKLVLPSQVRKVVIEVGVWQRSSFLKHLQKSDDLIVIGFEPQSVFANRHVNHPRLQIINAAVATRDFGSYTTFHAYRDTDSAFSSLLLLTGKQDSCGANGAYKVEVPVFTLEELLLLIPSHIDVPLVKVDAQGADLTVVLSAGPLISRVGRFMLEMQNLPFGHQDLLYVGQQTGRDVDNTLRVAGFSFERCWDENPALQEKNCVYARNDLLLDVGQDCFISMARKKWAKSLGRRYLGFRAMRKNWVGNIANSLEYCCCEQELGIRTALVDASKSSLPCPAFMPLAFCFDDTYTSERCCLQKYLRSIDYALDMETVRLATVWNHNASRMNLAWQVP